MNWPSIVEKGVIALALATSLAAQQENASLQSCTTPELITVPDGTPLVLQREKELSSASAKVGDSVNLTVAEPVRIGGLVIVHRGAEISGTVVKVYHRRRFARDGEVKVVLNDIKLPSGETVSLRPVLRPGKGNAKAVAWEAERTVVYSIPTFGVILPMAALIKGDEKVYPAGGSVTVYLNGPFTVNRSALKNLPYIGPAQVFFKNEDTDYVNLLVGSDSAGGLTSFLRVELNAGIYSFSTDKPGEPLQLELLNDHQYWIERVHGTLIVGDSSQHRDEMEALAEDSSVRDRNFTKTPQ